MKLLPSEIAPAPWWISNPARGKGPDMFVSSLPDNHMPSCAHALGYDSVLMRREGILIVTTAACTLPGTRERIGCCLPASTELRTGWDAELPCPCTEQTTAAASPGGGKPNATRSLQLLNCSITIKK
jgi:hypothetical protein